MWTYQVCVTTILLFGAFVSSVVKDKNTYTHNDYTNVNIGNKNERRDSQQSLNLSIVSTLPEIVERINSIVNHSQGGDWVNAIDELIKQVSDRLEHGHIVPEPQIAYPGKQLPIKEKRGPNLLKLLGIRNIKSVQAYQHQNKDRNQKPDLPYHKHHLFHKLIATLQQFGKFRNQLSDSNGSTENGMFIKSRDKLRSGNDNKLHRLLQGVHPVDNLQSSILEGNGDHSGNELGVLLHGPGRHRFPKPAQHGIRNSTKEGLHPMEILHSFIPDVNGNSSGNMLAILLHGPGPHRFPHPEQHGNRKGTKQGLRPRENLHSFISEGNGEMSGNNLDVLLHGPGPHPHPEQHGNRNDTKQGLRPRENLHSFIPEGKGEMSGNNLDVLLHGPGGHGKPHPEQHRDGTEQGLNRNPNRNPGRDHPHRKHGIDIDKLTPTQLHSLLQYLRKLKESNGRATFEPKLHELCCIVG